MLFLASGYENPEQEPLFSTFKPLVALHVHISNVHPDVVGVPAAQGELVQCLHCHAVFGDHMERVAHTRYNHMVETIDITSTDLDEVSLEDYILCL